MIRSHSLGMVDISNKESVPRVAEALGRIELKKETLAAIKQGTIKKGDPLSAAKIACALAAKKTHHIIPLCHPIPLTHVDLDFTYGAEYLEARCRVAAQYKTGVEMEALTGVTVALLTIWDMVKYMEKDEAGQYTTSKITEVRVSKKEKGRRA